MNDDSEKNRSANLKIALGILEEKIRSMGGSNNKVQYSLHCGCDTIMNVTIEATFYPLALQEYISQL